jgi:hypothetical protein
VKRTEFEHAIRAAAAVLGADEILVIGSQALHGSVAGALPEEALRSVEVDVAAFEDPEGRKADLIDGASAIRFPNPPRGRVSWLGKRRS